MEELILATAGSSPLAATSDYPSATVRVLERLNPFDPGKVNVHTLDWTPEESVASVVRRAGLDASEWILSQNGAKVALEDHDVVLALPGASIVAFPRLRGGAWTSLLVMSAALLTGFAAAAVLLMYSTLAIGTILSIAGAAAAIGGSLASWALQPALPSAPSFSMTYDPTGPKSLAQPGVPMPKAYGTFGWGGNCISSYVQYQGNNATIFALFDYGFGTASSISNVLLNGRAISTYENVSYLTRMGYPGVPPGTTPQPNANQQTPIAGFNRTENGYPMETELLVSNGPVVYEGIGTDVQGFDVTCKFPSGLYHVSAHGNFVPLRISYQIEISPHGLNQWTTPVFPRDDKKEPIYQVFQDGVIGWPYWVLVPTDRFAGTNICYASDGPAGDPDAASLHYPGEPATLTENVDVYDFQGNITVQQITVTGEWQPCDQSIAWEQVTGWWAGYRVLLESLQNAFFDTVSIYGLAPGQYDLRLTKMGYEEPGGYWVLADSTDSHYVCDIWFWNVSEITLQNLCYPSQVLIGVQGVANAQLNGTDLQLVATIQHGLGTDTILPSELASFEVDNPAIVAYDLLTNPLYGGGIPASQIDLPAWVEWAQFCDEPVTNQDGSTARRFVFAGVFDQTVTLWQALGIIGTMSRAAVLQYGATYTAVIDAPGAPVQLFTAASILEDSFQEIFTSTADRATIFEVKFADAARNYRMDLPVTLMGANALNGPVVPRTVSTSLTGCTSRDQAWRFAYFQLLTNQYCLRTVQFSVGLEGVACRLGSLIAVQSDYTGWANGGRVQAGSTSSEIVTEQPELQWAAGAGWTVAVQHPVVARGTATIASVSGNVVTCTAALPTARVVKAVSPAGVEYIVQGVSGDTLTVENPQPQASAPALAAGMVLTLYDQAVIDNFLVTGVSTNADGNSILSIAPNTFSATPTVDAPWIYGQSGGEQPAKIFRVVGMRTTSDLVAQITAVEYNPLCYVDVVPTYSAIIPPPVTDATVTNLSIIELFQNGAVTNSLDTSLIAVSWQNANKSVGGVLYTRVMPTNGLFTATQNLLPDTDLTQGATFWGNTATVNSLFSVASIAAISDEGFEFTNSGTVGYSPTNPVAPLADFSAQVPVVPGTPYTLSAYIDVSHVSGTSTWGLYLLDADTGATVASLTPAAGTAAGRVSVTFTMPASTVAVTAAPWTTNGTVAAGASVVVAQPMLQQSSTASGYVAGPVPTVLGESGWSIQQFVPNGNSASFVGTMGVTYQVQVRGVDAAGNLGQTPLYGAIGVLGFTNAPPGPQNFTVVQTAGGNVLTWSASAGAASYKIQYQDTMDVYALNVPDVLATVTGPTWTDTTVRTGIYMLFALGALPDQIQSAPSYASLVPPPPSNLTLTDDPSAAVLQANGTSLAPILAQWTPPQDSDVLTEGHIQVQYALLSATTAQPTSALPMTQLPSGLWQSGWVDAGEVSGAATSMVLSAIYEWESVIVQIRSVRANGQTSAWVQTTNAHDILRPIPIISLGNSSAMQLSYGNGALVSSLQPAQEGADVTAENTAYDTARVNTILSSDLIYPGAPSGSTGIDYMVEGTNYKRVLAGAFASGSQSQFAHSAMSAATQQAINSSGDVQNLGGTAAASITPIAGLMPAQAGADVTADHTAADTSNVNGIPSRTVSQGATGLNANLVPDSSVLFDWTYWSNPGADWSIVPMSETGTNGFEVSASASQSFQSSVSAQFSLIAGAVYTLSGWVNAAGVSAGTPAWILYNPALTVQYAASAAAAGSIARVASSFTMPVPSGYTSGQPVPVVLLFDTADATLSGPIFAAAPMVQQGSVATAYVPNLLDNTSGKWLHGAMSAATQQAVSPAGNLLLKNTTSVPGQTINPTLSSSWSDLPELGTGNPEMSPTLHGNPVLVASELAFSSISSGGEVTGIEYTFPATSGSQPPTISISISGDGAGASASVSWSGSPTSWTPTLTIGGGSGYTSAQASVTVTSNGDPNYSSGTTTYACNVSTPTPNVGVPIQSRLVMDGTIIAAPVQVVTDAAGMAYYTTTQLITPAPSPGTHSFEVQAYSSGSSPVESAYRTFQLIELG